MISLKKRDLYEDLMTSLDALNTNYIDFCFLHKDDVKISVGEIVQTLNKYKQ